MNRSGGHSRHGSVVAPSFSLAPRLAVLLGLLVAAGCARLKSPSATANGSGGEGGTGGRAGSPGSGGTAIDASTGTDEPTDEPTGADVTCASVSGGSVGCDFYSVHPDGGLVVGACLAAVVVNVSAVPATIHVDRAGVAFDVGKIARIPRGQGAALRYESLPGGVLPPKEVAIVFLSHHPKSRSPCPDGVEVGYETTHGDLDSHGGTSVIRTAFHISTTAPVAAYDIFPYGGGKSAQTSATLLLPTSSWDTSYMAVSSASPSPDVYAATIQVVASNDGTEVTIRPTVDVQSTPPPSPTMVIGGMVIGGSGMNDRAPVKGGSAGQVLTYHLQKGQMLQLAPVVGRELVGSPISSNKPIGLWAASGCVFVGAVEAACDSMHQQIPAVKALGHDYVAVRYPLRLPDRPESPPWRIVAVVDGTRLSYDPAAPSGAPTTLRAGEMVEFNTAEAFRVQSQDANHPFYMASYMTSCGNLFPPGTPQPFTDCRGDPEFVNLIPPEQFRSSYVFFTDPTYPETSLVVVRRRGQSGFADVKLDCAGVLGGFQPIGTSGEYEYTYVKLVSGDFEPQNGCDNGRHEITSTGKVGVTVWGWGSNKTHPSTEYCSYAYPAGAALRAINRVPPIVIF